MRQLPNSQRGATGSAGAWILTIALAPGLAAPRALADERPKPAKAVQVPAQGGEGQAPVPGAPPAVVPTLESRPARASLAAPKDPAERGSASAPESGPPRLTALSIGEGEATLEVDGVREVVRPGSRIATHVVKSVAPGRIVLTRRADSRAAGDPEAASAASTAGNVSSGWGEAPLVIVTFDAAGRGQARAIWASDPSAPAPAAEVQRP